MKSIRLLHITDFHFGKGNVYEDTADIKDKSVSKSIISKINSNWTEEFYSSIENWSKINRTKIDAIVCTGDIGDSGIPKNIELGVKFLEQLCQRLEIDKNQIYLCPGNHDLQRNNERTEFDVYERKLKAVSINNFSVYDNSFTATIKGIPLIALNSCLGGTSQSEFSIKFNKIIQNIPNEQRTEITDELNKLGQNYLLDFLDIPAIGNKQIKETLDFISQNDSDSAIILMHHNPVPNDSIEIRPYCNIVDSGKFLTELLNTKKKIFILHGHTHFNYDILSYFPNGDGNYISAIGCGALNDSANSKANIYEFYYQDDNSHIITKVHRIYRIGSASFGIKYSHNIFDKGISIDEAPIISKLLSLNDSIKFSDLAKDLKSINITEKLLLRTILKQESFLINIEKRDSDYFQNWVIIKKNN